MPDLRSRPGGRCGNFPAVTEDELCEAAVFSCGVHNMHIELKRGICMPKLVEISGVGPASEKVLSAAGYGTVEQVAAANAAELAGVSGVGEKRAASLISAAQSLLGKASESKAPISPASTSESAKKEPKTSEKSAGSKKEKPKKKKSGGKAAKGKKKIKPPKKKKNSKKGKKK